MSYKCKFCKETTRSKQPMIKHIVAEHCDEIMINQTETKEMIL